MTDPFTDSPASDSSGHSPDAASMDYDTTTTQTVDEIVEEMTAISPRIPARSRSDIWKHYIKLPSNNGSNLVGCHYCAKQYVNTNHGTGNLWRHFRKAHADVA